MLVVCPVCREMVYCQAGYIVQHGAKYHGMLDVCSASGTPYCYSADGCCGL